MKLKHTTQRVINGLLILVWGFLLLFLLFAGTAHGNVNKINEVLFRIAYVSICLYPIALLLSIFGNSDKMVKLPKLSILIQFLATASLYLSRLIFN